MRPLLNLWRRRRVRRYQVVGDPSRSAFRLAAWLLVIFVLHTTAMVWFEGLSLLEAVWLTATTMVTVGYGDFSAETPAGRLSTMLLLYAGAIFVLTKAVGDVLDAREDRAARKLRGNWDWKMRNHLLIVGNPGTRSIDEAQSFFARLIEQIRADRDWQFTPAQLLTTAFGERGLPPRLHDLGVVHFAGRVTEPADLAAVHPEQARAAIVLADTEADTISDALAFDAVDRLRRAGCTARLVVECVDDHDRPRLRAAGADAIVRPMRGYPEMLARALVAPGSEEIITDLFVAAGHECRRVNLSRPWRGSWLALCGRIMEARIGTPIAYADLRGAICTNPVAAEAVEAHALFIVVHDDCEAELGRVEGLIGNPKA